MVGVAFVTDKVAVRWLRKPSRSLNGTGLVELDLLWFFGFSLALSTPEGTGDLA